MRVGIITFHRANNYGAALQCYALLQLLTKLGYNTEIIDYRQPVIESMYKPIRWNVICQGLTRPRLLGGYLLKVLPATFKEATKKAVGYKHFRQKYFRTTYPFSKASDIPQDFDVYLVGSDQMWSIDLYCGSIDRVYFGDFPHPAKSRIVGYAISATLESLNKVGNNALRKTVDRFAELSFREQAVCDFVEQMTEVRGRVDLDPTLLINKEDWVSLCSYKQKVKGKYLLTYFMHEGAKDDTFKSQINQLAKKMECRVVNIHDIACAPDEFLSAIRYAQCIVTSSFHAVVFSILFNKTFYAINTHNGREIRYETLLRSLGLLDQYIESEQMVNLSREKINYSLAMSRLEQLRQESIKYLSTL